MGLVARLGCVALCLSALGCGSGGHDERPCVPEVEVLSVDRVLDPKLSGPAGTEVSLALTDAGRPRRPTYHLVVEVTGPGGPVRTVSDEDVTAEPTIVGWDGRDAGGAPVDPGEYVVHGTFSCADGDATFEEPVEVVRLGVREVRFLGGTGA